MKVSVIVSTRNREHAIIPCLDSIAAAIQHSSTAAEIIVVDNGSSDKTVDAVRAWTNNNSVNARLMLQPRRGKARSNNLAITAARGEILAFTDDDCRMHLDYLDDLLRHDNADLELIVRGGRVELGDPSDLPLTIKTVPEKQ